MNAITPPRPVSQTADTITLSLADWAAFMAQVENLEDLATVDHHDARVAAIGSEAVRREGVTGEEMMRILNGASPVTIWRERAKLSGKALAAAAGVSPSYLAEIEGGKKPGSVAALAALAEALGVSMDALV